MAVGIKISATGVEQVQLSPEDETYLADHAQRSQANQAAKIAARQRKQEIRASEFITQIEDAMRGKTYAEINTFIDGMTAAQRDRAFKGLLLKWAVEVKNG